MAWKNGPLPKDTYGWGGVVPHDMDLGSGFLFADFCGNCVVIDKGGKNEKTLKPHEVKFYDNSLELPPKE